MAELSETIKKITQRIEKTGDLPVFSASVNRIRQISSNAEATAMSLSNEATKDVNLTAKLLRLANSSHYNRGKGKISVVSRAVVILGFNTVNNQCLTMKLIESFQHEHPSIDMNKMLVHAYLTAGFVREIAAKAGVKDVEEAYTCALIHNLGEIALAYFLPERYAQMRDLQTQGKLSWSEIEKQVLGGSIREIGQVLAKNWGFPANVISSMEPFNPDKDSAKSSVQMNRALASLASSVVSTLRNDHGGTEDLNETLSHLAKTAGVQPTAIENSLVDSFKMSCELANDYGLTQEALMPTLTDTGDEKRDRIASRLAFFAANDVGSRGGNHESHEPVSSETESDDQAGSETSSVVDTIEPEDASTTSAVATKFTEYKSIGNRQNGEPPPNVELSDEPVPPSDMSPLVDSTDQSQSTQTTEAAGTTDRVEVSTTPSTSLPPEPDLTTQLSILQELTFLISSQANLQQIFQKALEGVHRGVAFDRGMLALISSDRSSYAARLVTGHNVQQLQSYFKFPINEEHDIFSRVMMEGSELLVHDVSEEGWRRVIRPDFVDKTGTRSFILASLRIDTKALGFIYADNVLSSAEISAAQHRGFIQFVAQARLAIQMGANAQR